MEWVHWWWHLRRTCGGGWQVITTWSKSGLAKQGCFDNSSLITDVLQYILCSTEPVHWWWHLRRDMWRWFTSYYNMAQMYIDLKEEVFLFAYKVLWYYLQLAITIFYWQGGWHALMYASQNGHVVVLDRLVQHGATVDLQTEVHHNYTFPCYTY